MSASLSLSPSLRMGDGRREKKTEEELRERDAPISPDDVLALSSITKGERLSWISDSQSMNHVTLSLWEHK